MSDVTPALTPEEWGNLFAERGDVYINACRVHGMYMQIPEEEPDDGLVPDDARHAIAALALYRQPFGFAEDAADMVRLAADQIHDEWETPELRAVLHAIADRIAALLPPEREK